MTQSPKEKAKELVDKFYQTTPNDTWIDEPLGEFTKTYTAWGQAKQCALIAVDEILNSSPLEPNFADWDDCGGEFRYWYDAQKTHAFYFWKEVKQEIEKL